MTTPIQTPERKEEHVEQTDIAPDASAAAMTTDVSAPLQQGETAHRTGLHLEPVKRKKTWGERRFDLVTYGGWALLGNEAASLAITESVGKNFEGKPRFARGLYEKFESKVGALSKYFEGFKQPGFLRYVGDYIGGTKLTSYIGAHVPRLPYLLVATIGGMLVVPFVKDREDRKGEIVRKLDQKHYGMARAEQNPELVRAHKEMDEAPKQTWGSLWKGRVTTVLSATVADFAFGWPEALTTKIFKNNATYQKYASLERLSDVFAEKTTKMATARFDLGDKSQKIMRKVVGNGTWLLTLSSSLTVLFYASSKLFARKREEKIERKEYLRTHPEARRDEAGDIAADTGAEMPDSSPVPERPRAQVTTVAHEKTVTANAPLVPTV